VENQQAWNPVLYANVNGKANAHAASFKWSCANILILSPLVSAWHLHPYQHGLGHRHPYQVYRGLSPSHHRNWLKCSRRLWTDEAVYDKTCKGVQWISQRTFW
jgi:hypothetical protein